LRSSFQCASIPIVTYCWDAKNGKAGGSDGSEPMGSA